MANRTKRTPRRQKLFIQELRNTCNVSQSCQVAEIARSIAYKWREEDETFATAWDDAIEEATDALELEARYRALEGIQRIKFYQGQPIMIQICDDEGKPLESDTANART